MNRSALGEAAEHTGTGTTDWDRVADVVVIGAGAAGLPAAIRARDLGASVILVEENTDIGGHAMISGGIVGLGGGTRLQKKFGIEDSADQIYLEMTNPDHPQMRFTDRKIARAFANVNVEVFDFLESNGVVFADAEPMNFPATGTMTSRWQQAVRWSDDLNETINGTNGSGVARALETAARAKGAEILLQHRMTNIIRETPRSGRVLGVAARRLSDDVTINIRADSAVIVCTGGSSSNMFVRTMFDPRLTAEYHTAGEVWSRQSGDGEQLGMSIGAALGATSNARTEAYNSLDKPSWIGCRDGYLRWNPGSPVFSRAGASGLGVTDYQNAIHVNAVGRRFFNEMAKIDRLEPDGMRLVHDYCAAAFASAVVDGPDGKQRVGGPVWAIFDADAVRREEWDPRPPFVDIDNGYFFVADSLAELAAGLSDNRYQPVPMSGAVLEDTVARYNSFVDAGEDPDFGKPSPAYKIQTPPFYAAWATPVLHDCFSGLRVDENSQVIDVFGELIPGFYCAGESAGGFALHGLGRCIASAYLAATHATRDRAATNGSVDHRAGAAAAS